MVHSPGVHGPGLHGAGLHYPGIHSKITFDALGWRMAERLAQTPLLAGDAIDVSFTIGHNDHPDYGGLELTLRDFRIPPAKRD